MMKKLYLLSIAILLCAQCSYSQQPDAVIHVSKRSRCHAPQPQNDLERMRLSGRVKTTHTTLYHDDLNKPGFLIELSYVDVDSYDVAGNVRHSAHLYQDGRPPRLTDKTYDAQGRLKAEVIFNDIFHSNIAMRYFYDSRGHLKLKSRYAVDSLGNKEWDIDSTVYTYDARDRLTLIKSRLDPVETFAYDADGNCIKYTSIRWRTDTATELYLYDGKCRLIEMHESGYNGKFEFTTTYQYDGRDSVIRSAQKNDLGPGVCDRTYEYDDHGNVTTALCSACEEPIIHNRYIYDTHGNWTRREVYLRKEQKLDSYEVRTIEYY